jgi:hypothetical protein
MIKAIETRYKGYRFRSRLEARWAVFFDALGLEWEYEKEGYELPSGSYLPDFWFPEINDGCWVEIKGKNCSVEELNKAADLCEATGCEVFIFDSPLSITEVAEAASYSLVPHENGRLRAGYDIGHKWCECPTCRKVGIEFDGRADRIECQCREQRLSAGDSADRGHNYKSKRLIAAFTAALSARFEHGETP